MIAWKRQTFSERSTDQQRLKRHLKPNKYTPFTRWASSIKSQTKTLKIGDSNKSNLSLISQASLHLLGANVCASSVYGWPIKKQLKQRDNQLASIN